LDDLRLHRRAEARMTRKLDAYLRECRWILASNEKDLRRIQEAAPERGTSLLRRGIDKETFHPGRRDRRKLHEVYGVPPDLFLLLFVGRLDAAKRAETAALAARQLADRGAPVHILFAGDGAQRKDLEEIIGPWGTFVGGGLPQSELG